MGKFVTVFSVVLLLMLIAAVVYPGINDMVARGQEEARYAAAPRASVTPAAQNTPDRPSRVSAPVFSPAPKPTASPAPTAPPTPTQIPTPAPTPSPTPAPTPPPEPSPPPTPMPTATDREFAEADEAPQEGGAVIDKPSALPGMTPAAPDEDLTLQKHYIEENLNRYLSFMAANTAYSARLAVSLVNLNADYGFYEAISTVANPSDLLALCNKNHQLPEDYAPEGLRAVKGASRLMRGDAAAAYESMSAALKEETGLGLVVVSAYRDFKYQDNLFKKYSKRDGAAVADTYSARAGHSEHQTGLTADIGQKSPSSGMTSLKFQNTPQYEWLLENAHKYGYILRYPKGYEAVTGYMFEPWHWRFIGVGDATAMYEGGYTTFEEYIGEFTPGEVNE